MSNVDQFFQWEREIEFSIVDVGFNGCISGYGAKFISVDIEQERAQNRALGYSVFHWKRLGQIRFYSHLLLPVSSTD
jgi:hypothetical protein